MKNFIDDTLLAKLFAEIFNIPAVQPDDDFFDLGGDSLLAESLMTSMEQHFGIAVPVTYLLENSTPRRLAELIFRMQARRPARSLIRVRADGRGAPVFCLHGMDGHSAFPRKLTQRLGQDRPIYALRALGLLAGEIPAASVEEMAAMYRRDISKVRMAGGCAILGQCGASFVAYELAQQIIASGKKVAALILIDPLHDDALLNDFAPWLTAGGLALAIKQKHAEQLTAAAVNLARSGRPMTGADRFSMVRMAIRTAIAAYTPRPYPGEALVISSNERRQELMNPERGLPMLIANLHSKEIDADHNALLTTHSTETMAAIGNFLDRQVPIPALGAPAMVQPSA